MDDVYLLILSLTPPLTLVLELLALVVALALLLHKAL
jgi:hypothetical protein